LKTGFKYTIQKKDATYFLTMTVVDWVDVFTREIYCKTIINTLDYCIKYKGLNVYAFCIMSNHIHLVVNCNSPFELSDVIRDFKKFTAREILHQIHESKESRRDWILDRFRKAAEVHSKTKNFKFWQDGNRVIELYSAVFTWIRINYIHKNPVKAGLVRNMADWKYSSASNYVREESVLDKVICLAPPVKGLD
jgi:REP element-mobilizing transposase RayT